MNARALRGVDLLRGWGEALASFFYPAWCQICRGERAEREAGYVGPACSTRPGNIVRIGDPTCERCGLPFEGEITTRFTCSNCRGAEWHFERARSAVKMKGLIPEIVHRYKYNRALWFEPFLARLLIEASLPSLRGEPWEAVVPIPLHPLKQREREFNQSERLARRLAEASGLPLRTDLLRRAQFTRTQTRLSREERDQNVRKAFEFIAESCPRRVVLVDDVLTTGATTNACARVLRKAGAERVVVWTVARGV